MGFWSFANGIGNMVATPFKTVGSLFSGDFESVHNNDPLAQIWKGFTGQGSNELIADANLQYQRERNEIEDARYVDETAYNRAFAEDERAYNRAFAEDERDYQRQLQQQIFDREDTAIERQYQQLMKLGINPLSQNMSGLGSGSVVSQPTSAVADEPAMSARGGTALHDDRQAFSPLSALGGFFELANSIDGLYGNSINRDLLAQQRDFNSLRAQLQQMENLVYAAQNDITINDDGSMSLGSNFVTNQSNSAQQHEATAAGIENTRANTRKTSADASRSERVDVFQDKYGTTDESGTVARSVAEASSMADAASDAATALERGDVSTNPLVRLWRFITSPTERMQNAINSRKRK